MKLQHLKSMIREELDRLFALKENWQIGDRVMIPMELRDKIKDSMRRETIGGTWSHSGKPDVAKSFEVVAVKSQGNKTMLKLQQSERGVVLGHLWIDSDAVEKSTGLQESDKKTKDEPVKDFAARYTGEFVRGDQVDLAKNITDRDRETLDVASKAELELVDQSEPFEIVSMELQGEEPVYVIRQNYINIKAPAKNLKPIKD